MREKSFIDIITGVLGSEYIGDDCAFLADLGIVVTQDNLVEDVHFLRNLITPFQLGYKSVMVNISDICASGAEPKYLTIGLSLPNDVDENYLKAFYDGAKLAAGGAKIVGGDITGGDKILISVAAIGQTLNRKISGRNNAKVGQKLVIAGLHGFSGIGLDILSGKAFPELTSEEKQICVNAHLTPEAQLEFSNKVQDRVLDGYAMMDTSDGLADALYRIADASGVLLEVDVDKIPILPFAKRVLNFEHYLLYGAEDYGLVATVDNSEGLIEIGEVKEGSGVTLNHNGRSQSLTKEVIEKNIYKHFKEQDIG